MKKVSFLRFIKNFSFFILKILLISLFIYSVSIISVNFYENIKENYSNYTFVRGLENYGNVTEGTLISQDSINYLYSYEVNGEKYFINLEENDSSSVDKSVKIIYDTFEPNVSIFEKQVNQINSFYADTLKSLGFVYVKLFILVVILGILWFLLDVVKYNKKLWNIYV